MSMILYNYIIFQQVNFFKRSRSSSKFERGKERYMYVIQALFLCLREHQWRVKCHFLILLLWQVKVSSKTKHVVHFNVKAGDVIIWEFATKKRDIAFGEGTKSVEVHVGLDGLWYTVV